MTALFFVTCPLSRAPPRRPRALCATRHPPFASAASNRPAQQETQQQQQQTPSAPSASSSPSPAPSAGQKPDTAANPTVPAAGAPTLYDDLGLPPTPDPASLPLSTIRAFYLAAARAAHPDINPAPGGTDGSSDSSDAFERAARAWAVLSDPVSRRLYDAAGEPALAAVASIEARAAALRARLPGLAPDELDHLADTGALVGSLLSPAANPAPPSPSSSSSSSSLSGEPARGEEASPDDGSPPPPPEGTTDEDACPRSVEDAVYKLQHPALFDPPTIYYTLWWVYRFRVREAAPQLTSLLADASGTRAFALRRRSALALGAVAAPPADTPALHALADALHADDYFLRYRAAEAIANIAMRTRARSRSMSSMTEADAAADAPTASSPQIPASVLQSVLKALRRGADAADRRAQARDGFESQESLFDLDALPAETRAKLEAVFRNRRDGEARARRTTMTPQLGVDTVGREGDEPLEWLLKAASALVVLWREDEKHSPTASTSTSTSTNAADPSVEEREQQKQQQEAMFDEVVSLARRLEAHDVPLVRYAACKALFAVTGEAEFAERIVAALDFGVEHHYSQRVLIRDLGDLAYSAGAQAVAQCPMVENSFKILALKNMLNGHDCDPAKSEVRNVLAHMDSLL